MDQPTEEAGRREAVENFDREEMLRGKLGRRCRPRLGAASGGRLGRPLAAGLKQNIKVPLCLGPGSLGARLIYGGRGFGQSVGDWNEAGNGLGLK